MALGIMKCLKHGTVGWDETCEHLDEELKRGVYGPYHYIIVWAGVRVCEKCWQDFNMEYYETHPDIADKDFFEASDSPVFEEYCDEVYEKLKRGGWCLQCLAEIEVSQARRNGEPDPFPVYEKTLGKHDTEIIAALHQFLLKNFSFRKVAEIPSPFHALYHREDLLALFIRAGQYTFPLILTAYYITDKTEQEYILRLIREFLDGQARNQAKVEFYEAEVWELLPSPNPEIAGPGLRKGEEKLLREVWLNC